MSEAATPPAAAALLAALAAGAALLLLAALASAARQPRGPARGAPPGRAPLGHRHGRLLRAAMLVLLAAGTAAVAAYLALGAPPARLALPFRLAGVAPVLALDALAAVVLLALLPLMLAWLAVAPPGRLAAPAMGTGAAAILALLGAAAGPLALAVAAACLAAGTRARAWIAAGAAATLVAALALPAGDGAFAALRAARAGDAAMAPMLALMLGLGLALATLAPALPPAPAEEPPQAARLGAQVLGLLGLYLLLRGVPDLGGPRGAAWALAPLLAGAAAAILGAAAALRAPCLGGVIAGIGMARGGLCALGLALALAARAGDDGPAAALALGAALLLALVLSWAQALLALVAHGLGAGAGSAVLDRLGGLAARMRFTAIGALAAALAVAMLPPGAGFAGLWLMLRAAVTLPRGGGPEGWAMAALVAVALGLAAALLACAVLRLLGVAFLGRPRTPRAAAAEEVAPARRWAMLGFAAQLGLAGLLPGPLLGLATPAIAPLAGAAPPGGVLSLAGYAPLGLALLLALAATGLALLLRLLAPAGHRVAPAWEGGAPPPPAWLPFGDPTTQPGAASFAAVLPRLPAWRPPSAAPLRALAPWARRLAAMPARAGALPALALLLGLLLLHGTGVW